MSNLLAEGLRLTAPAKDIGRTIGGSLWNPPPAHSVVDETMANGVPWEIWRRSSLCWCL